MSLPQNAAELEQLLLGMNVNDNEVIAKSSATLKQFLKNAASIQPMIQQIISSPHVLVRQMAAVLLAKSAKKTFPSLSVEVQDELKQVLMRQLVEQPDRRVRRSVAALISILAQVLIPAKRWNDLLDFLMKMLRSNESSHRHVAMLLFRALAENIGKHLKPHFRTLQSIFASGLQDPDEGVRIEAIYAIGELIPLIENEATLANFKQILAPMFALTQQHVQEAHGDIVAAIFEVFEQFAASPVEILDAHFVQLTQLMLQVAQSPQLDSQIRDKAVAFIVSIVEAKPSKFTKSGLVEPSMNAALKLMSESAVDVSQPEDDDDGPSPQAIGTDLLDGLLQNVPKKVIFQPTLNTAMSMITQPAMLSRKAGILMLAVLSDGCGEQLLGHFDRVLPPVIQALKDPQPVIRLSAAVAITQFGERLEDEFAAHHESVLPALLTVIDNPQEHSRIKEQCCCALDNLVEYLEEGVREYAAPLMQRLLSMLPKSSTSVQVSICAAIRSIAMAITKDFLPYAQATMSLLVQPMQLTEERMLSLRARATECAGAVAAAIGHDAFAPYLQITMRCAMTGAVLDFPEVRDASFQYFGRLAIAERDGMAPLLSSILPLLCASLGSDDGLSVSGPSSAFDELDGDDEVDDGERELEEGS